MAEEMRQQTSAPLCERRTRLDRRPHLSESFHIQHSTSSPVPYHKRCQGRPSSWTRAKRRAAKGEARQLAHEQSTREDSL